MANRSALLDSSKAESPMEKSIRPPSSSFGAQGTLRFAEINPRYVSFIESSRITKERGQGPFPYAGDADTFYYRTCLHELQLACISILSVSNSFVY